MSVVGTWFDKSPNKDFFKKAKKYGKRRKRYAKKAKKG